MANDECRMTKEVQITALRSVDSSFVIRHSSFGFPHRYLIDYSFAVASTFLHGGKQNLTSRRARRGLWRPHLLQAFPSSERARDGGGPHESLFVSTVALPGGSGGPVCP